MPGFEEIERRMRKDRVSEIGIAKAKKDYEAGLAKSTVTRAANDDRAARSARRKAPQPEKEATEPTRAGESVLTKRAATKALGKTKSAAPSSVASDRENVVGDEQLQAVQGPKPSIANRATEVRPEGTPAAESSKSARTRAKSERTTPEIQVSQAIIEVAREDRSRVKGEIEEAARQLAESRRELETVKAALAAAQDQRTSAEVSSSDIQSKLDATTAAMQELVGQKQALEAQLQSERDSARSAEASAQIASDDTARQLAESRRELETVKAALAAAQDQRTSAEVSSSDIQSKLDATTAAMQELVGQKQALEAQLQSERDSARSAEASAQMASDDTARQLAESRRELETVKAALAAAQDQRTSAEVSSSDTQSKMDATTAAMQELVGQKQALEAQLQSERDSARSAEASAQMASEEAARQLAESRRELETVKAALAAAQDQRTSAEVSSSDTQSKLDATRAAMQELVGQKQALEAQLQSERDSARSAEASAQMASEEAARQLAESRRELETVKAALAAAQDQRTSVEVSSSDTQSKLDATRAAMQELVGQKQALVAQLQSERDSARSADASAQMASEEAARQLAESRRELETVNAALAAAQDERISAEVVSSEMESKFRAAVQELSSERDQLKTQATKLQIELADRDTEISSFKARLAQEEEQRKNAEMRASISESKLSTAANDQGSDRPTALQAAFEESQKRVESLERDLRSAETKARNEFATRIAAQAEVKAAVAELQHEKAAREAAEKAAQEATRSGAQVEQAGERMKTMADRNRKISNSELGEHLAEERTAWQAESAAKAERTQDAGVKLGGSWAKEAPARGGKTQKLESTSFETVVADLEAGLKSAANSGKTKGSSRTPQARAPVPPNGETVWYRAGNTNVPDQQYEKMLKRDLRNTGASNTLKGTPLSTEKSEREVLLLARNGNLHSPRAYRSVHGKDAYEALARAEGFDPSIANRLPARDSKRPEILVLMKNGSLVNGDKRNLIAATGKQGLVKKFGEERIFVQNQGTRGGTGNYRRLDNALERARRLDNAIERARPQSNVEKLSQRLASLHVIPEPQGRGLRSVTPTLGPTLKRSLSPVEMSGSKAASPKQEYTRIWRDGKVVASVPAGGIKRLNNNQAASPSRSTTPTSEGPYSGSRPSSEGRQNSKQTVAHTQTSPTATTINLTVNGSVGRLAADVRTNPVSESRNSYGLDPRDRSRDSRGRG